MASEPTCGNWKPEIISEFGKVPLDAVIAEEVIDCVITDVSPKTDLNVLGAQNITLTGSNLPKGVSDDFIEIQFDDSKTTKCIPQHSASGSLVCMTQSFNKATSLGSSLGF